VREHSEIESRHDNQKCLRWNERIRRTSRAVQRDHQTTDREAKQ
jgi:hypothetical protein